MTAPDLATTARPPAVTWAEHVRATVTLGLPLIGAQLGQMAINLTDTLMIGRLGAEPLAAAVLATQLFFVVLMTISGFAAAVLPLAAKADSAGDISGVRRAVRMGLWAVIGASLAALGLLWTAEAFFLALGQEPEIAAMAGRYLRIAMWGLLPGTVILTLRSYLSALERTEVVLWTTLIGVAVNAVLDYALIFGAFGAPALGIEGAAMASVGTMLAMAGAILGYAVWAPALQKFELLRRFWRPDWPALVDVCRIGLPIGLTLLAEVGLFAATSLLMGWIDTVTLAAHGIALSIISVLFMVPYGLAQAATVRVGRAAGRGDRLAIARAGWSALWITLGVAGLAAALLLGAPTLLIGAFLDQRDADYAAILATGQPLLTVAAAFQLVDMVQVVALSLLRGLRDTAVPMAIALFSYWAVGLPVAALLGFPVGLGGVGIWAGLALGLTVAATLLTGRFWLRDRFGLEP